MLFIPDIQEVVKRLDSKLDSWAPAVVPVADDV
jgi:hypothetical protein